jgi:hypothetical protein
MPSTKEATMPKPSTKTRAPKRRRLASRGDAVTTSVILPRALHSRAMIASVNLNWAFSEVVRQALGEWLDRNKQAGRSGR